MWQILLSGDLNVTKTSQYICLVLLMGKQEAEMPIDCSPQQCQGIAVGEYDIITMLDICGSQYNDIKDDKQYITVVVIMVW